MHRKSGCHSFNWNIINEMQSISFIRLLSSHAFFDSMNVSVDIHLIEWELFLKLFISIQFYDLSFRHLCYIISCFIEIRKFLWSSQHALFFLFIDFLLRFRGIKDVISSLRFFRNFILHTSKSCLFFADTRTCVTHFILFT